MIRKFAVMKPYALVLLALIVAGTSAAAQSIVGTWQLVGEKTCLESQMTESSTEQELKQSMSSERSSVARVIKFKNNGTGEEGIFTAGSRKGGSMNAFRYRVNGKEILLLDKKSGTILQTLVMDEFSSTALRVHISNKDCETKSFTRIK